MVDRFRYARTLGEFLPSFQVNRLSPVNTFTTLEAYDLNKQFAFGDDKHQDSFTSPNSINSYYTSTEQLVGWYRLGNTSDVSVVKDKSKNSHDLTAAGDPVWVPDDMPSNFISVGSLLFDGTGDELSTTTAAAATKFSFADGGKDLPFSVSMWVKIDSVQSDIFYLVSKGQYTINGEWLVSYTHYAWGGHILFQLVQESGLSDPTAAAGFYISPAFATHWNHLVFTYDGSAASAAGGTSDNGMKCYLNGTLAAIYRSTHASYAGMVRDTGPLYVGGAGGSYFKGNMTDVAVWRKELSSSEVATLYGVKGAGAYRLVRDYNDKGTLAGESLGMPAVSQVGLDTIAAASDAFRQGININTLGHLTNYMQRKARPNTGFLMTIDGRDIPRNAFNDNLSPTGLSQGVVTGTNTSIKMNVAAAGRLDHRVSHEREIRDLGMSTLYSDNEPFHEPILIVRGVFSPVEIIKMPPLKRILPTYLVDQSNETTMDGVLEPFPIREIIDGSSTEVPFHSRGFRADLGGSIDSFRRSIIIDHGWNLGETGASPFLDSVELMGMPDQNDSTVLTGSITMQGVFYQNPSLISPFVDRENDMQNILSGAITQDIANILTSGSATGGSKVSDNSNKNFDIMGSRGFVFNNDSTHIDSIAYGGWKK